MPWPRIGRPLVDLDRHVGEARRLHLLLVARAAVDRRAEAPSGLEHVRRPLAGRRVWRDGIVVALQVDGDVYDLEPAPGGEVAGGVSGVLLVCVLRRGLLVASPDEGGPVLDCAREHAGVDEVELCAECPCVLEVVDVIAHIWRDAVETYQLPRWW